MRLKNFQAPTMAEAMELVRESLGADAIIVSTNEDDNGGGVRITAAIEQDDPETLLSTEPALDLVDVIGEALDRHGVPTPLADQILSSISLLGHQDPPVALAGALDMAFAFKSLGERDHAGPLVFVGPPGGGKTVTIAKLAAAGALEQFKSYGERLGILAEIADDPATLAERVEQTDTGTLTLIDTTSTNPYASDEMDRLRAFTGAVEGESILVLPGILDAGEAGSLAGAFAPVAPTRVAATCLDLTARIGALLSVASQHNLALSDIGVTPTIADGLKSLNPVALAQLLLSETVHGTILPSPEARKRQATGSE